MTVPLLLTHCSVSGAAPAAVQTILELAVFLKTSTVSLLTESDTTFRVSVTSELMLV